jgi:hypothetical protein
LRTARTRDLRQSCSNINKLRMLQVIADFLP